MAVALSRNLFLLLNNLVTDRAVLSLGLTRSGTSGCHSGIDYLSMTCCRNHFLRSKDFITASTFFTSGNSILSAGSILRFTDWYLLCMFTAHNTYRSTSVTSGILVIVIFVTKFGNNRLCREDFLTHRTMFTFRQTVSDTGSCHGSIDRLGVAQCSYSFLSYKNFLTDGAVLALRQTGFGAGSCNGSIDHFSVAQCINDSLSNQNLVADGAVLAFGQTSFGAGSCNGSIDHFSVAKCINDSLSNQNLVTDGAVLAFGQTGFGAGSCNGSIDHFSVALGRNSILILHVIDNIAYSRRHFCIDTLNLNSAAHVNTSRDISRLYRHGNIDQATDHYYAKHNTKPDCFFLAKYKQYNNTTYCKDHQNSPKNHMCLVSCCRRISIC